MLQRAAHHCAHQIAAIGGIGLVIFERIDGVARGFRRRAEGIVVRRRAI